MHQFGQGQAFHDRALVGDTLGQTGFLEPSDRLVDLVGQQGRFGALGHYHSSHINRTRGAAVCQTTCASLRAAVHTDARDTPAA